MRQVNGKLLKQWLELKGENSRVHLHLKSGVSLDWISKVIHGRYHSAPKQITIRAVVRATGLNEADLFPLVKPKRSKVKALLSATAE